MAVVLDSGDPVVVDRRRIQMVEDDRDAYHAAAERSASPEAGAALIDRVATAAREGAAREIATTVKDLREAGHDIVAAGVPLGRSLPPLASILRSHPLLHTAEGELYREALAEGADECRLRVTEAPVKTLLPFAARVLGRDEQSLRRTLTALGKVIGPPWQKDHKDAAVLAWLALTAAS